MASYREGKVHCKFCSKEFDRKKIPFVQIPVGKAMRYAHPECYKNAVMNGLIEDKYVVTDPSNSVMCPYCQKPVLKNSVEAHKDNEIYYHESCWAQKQLDPKTPEEKLKDLLISLCGWENVPPGALKQIQKMITENNFSYNSIRGTLTYWYIVKGEKLNKENPLGIVPYVHEQARAFYQKKKEIREKNNNLIAQMPTKINYLTIKKPILNPRKNTEFSFLDDEEEQN